MLGAILDDEMKHASRIVARDVTLQLPLDKLGLRLAAAPGQVLTTSPVTSVPLGGLASGEVRKVLLRLDRTPEVVRSLSAGALNIASPLLSYRQVGSSATTMLSAHSDAFQVTPAANTAAVENSRRDDVRARILEMQTSLKLTEAMGYYQSADLSSAVTTLEQNVAALKALAGKTNNQRLQAEAETLDRVMQKMRNAAPTSSAGADLVKAQKARAYSQRR